MRVGIGYDSHRFAPPGPLMLGGVAIPSDVRLQGHSDGDAIQHAVTDAILGAAALGDIGDMFSDKDPENKDKSSTLMLAAAVRRLADHGWSVNQVDVTVVAEKPRIAPYRDEMCARLANTLDVAADCVSIKGKTNEGMGWIGRAEGIACMAVATIARSRDAG